MRLVLMVSGAPGPRGQWSGGGDQTGREKPYKLLAVKDRVSAISDGRGDAGTTTRFCFLDRKSLECLRADADTSLLDVRMGEQW